MGDSEKLQFYEIDYDESKMGLLKTHSHASKQPGYEARKTRSRALEGNADPTTRQSTHQNPAAFHRCGGGVGGEKALRQTNHRKGTMARQTLVEAKGNTGANTRERSCQKPPADHWHDGGLDEETTNTRNGR